MSKFGAKSGKSGSVTIQNGQQVETDCACQITRSVTGLVTLDKDDPSFWSCFLKVIINVECGNSENWNHTTIHPGEFKGDTAMFKSLVTTSCSFCDCNQTPVSCIQVFTSTETSDDGRGRVRGKDMMPEWAQKLLSNGPSTLNRTGREGNTADAAAILKSVHWAGVAGGLEWGGTDSTGHPTCASLKGKGCCGEDSPGPFGSSTPLD
jgi:hypothetical protein